MGPIQSIGDFISLIWRRLPLVMTVLVVGLLWALYLAVTSPAVYEARAVIQVNAPVISDTVTRSAPPAALRVQQIEQRLMSRENMLRLIDRYDLFGGVQDMPDSFKIEVLRSNTRIESIAASATGIDSPASLASIVISTRAGQSQTAANVANDLANDVVTSDRRNRENRIADATDFLNAELLRVEGELDKQDREIATYTAANEDSLPESRAFLQAELVSLAERETITRQNLMTTQRERLALEQTPVSDDSASIVQQLRSAEVALAQARRTLPAGHPEIQRLERVITAINEGSSDEGGSGLGRQLSLIDSQIVSMETSMEEIEQRQAEIRQSQSRTSEVLQVYEQLQRSRQHIADQYTELSRRLAEIDALRLLSENNQTENMVILEPAVPPEFPVASNRKRSAILGAFLSIAVAGGLALFLDLLNPVLRNSRQFEAVTGLRPVISLPFRPSDEEEFRQLVRNTYVVSVAVLGLLLALWMMNLMPGWLADMLPPSVRQGGGG
ncbi:lipopolysaccharide biosynthesis protein [Paracoccus sp. M683]|uniref:GumC family protein n=1 Tax=Paracoccus sp. M683 TaxID=2594268 RepID=UPI0011967A36|nr:Wzz/FepE/Etk N-terminal domain-containing protein [Paracoccus sp. M683]TRW95786.1 lipopolysaccharide biosynthesis protein [Paracoccus sp. M683]